MAYSGCRESPPLLGVQAVKATLDEAGRIALPAALQAQLGVKAGDEVLLEEQGGVRILRAARPPAGLCWKGNVLVHEGVSPMPLDQGVSQDRHDRMDSLAESLPR